MLANMENSVVVTGLEKVGFHTNLKERQCQRMFKLRHNCTHFTRQQSNAQNPPSQASTVYEMRTFRCSSWIQKRQRDKRLKCQQTLDHRKSQRIPDSLTTLKSLTLWITQQMVRNYYSRDANTRPPNLPSEKCVCRSTVKTGHGTDSYKTGRGIHQGYIFSLHFLASGSLILKHRNISQKYKFKNTQKKRGNHKIHKCMLTNQAAGVFFSSVQFSRSVVSHSL